jgi:hypothetical protein
VSNIDCTATPIEGIMASSSSAAAVQQSSSYQDEWICTNCDTKNFMSKSLCQNSQCGKLRSSDDHVTLAWPWSREGWTDPVGSVENARWPNFDETRWINFDHWRGTRWTNLDVWKQQLNNARATAASATEILWAARSHAVQAMRALREMEELQRTLPENTDTGSSSTVLADLIAVLTMQNLDNQLLDVQQAFENTAAATGPIREAAPAATHGTATSTLSWPDTGLLQDSYAALSSATDVNIESLPSNDLEAPTRLNLVRGGHELRERSDARSRSPTTSRTATMEAALNDSNPALPHW